MNFAEVIESSLKWMGLQMFYDRRGNDRALIEDFEKLFLPQSSSWDCGIACAEMTLRWWNDPLIAINLFREFREKKTPLWTIDLFVALREAGVDGASMYTSVVGVNPNHYVSWICSDRSFKFF